MAEGGSILEVENDEGLAGDLHAGGGAGGGACTGEECVGYGD